MNTGKPGRKTGLIPKLKSFIEALGDRYQRALQVIDEALDSENLKDRIWAVDLILKRTPAEPPAEKTAGAKAKSRPPESLEKLEELNDPELIQRIRKALSELEP